MQLTAKLAHPMRAPRRGGTYSCTLGTARDKNFKIVPAALLESSGKNGAIKAQWHAAVLLPVANRLPRYSSFS